MIFVAPLSQVDSLTVDTMIHDIYIYIMIALGAFRRHRATGRIALDKKKNAPQKADANHKDFSASGETSWKACACSDDNSITH